MNEKRQEKQQFFKPTVDMQQVESAEIVAMAESLIRRADVAGAYAIMRQLEQLRKNLLSSRANKKMMRAAVTKMEKLQRELNQKVR